MNVLYPSEDEFGLETFRYILACVYLFPLKYGFTDIVFPKRESR